MGIFPPQKGNNHSRRGDLQLFSEKAFLSDVYPFLILVYHPLCGFFEKYSSFERSPQTVFLPNFSSPPSNLFECTITFEVTCCGYR